MLRTKLQSQDLNTAAYPLQLFSIGFVILQILNIYEWLWEIQPTLNTIYLVYAMLSTAFKIDLTIVGVVLSLIYKEKLGGQIISKNIKATVHFFFILGGLFTVIQLIVTVLCMHQYTFSVIWTLLLLMVGQSMLEVIVFCMMLFFSLLLIKQYEEKATAQTGKDADVIGYHPL